MTTATDLLNVLDAVELPIVVVRGDLRIIYFNKVTADLLGLSTSDIGRSCGDISGLAGFPRLEEQCSEVFASGLESRADSCVRNRWFVVRISPHTTGECRETRAIVTFTDVTAFRASSNQAIYEREFTKAILNTVANPLIVLSADERIQTGNRAFHTMFGVSRDETQGIRFSELGRGAFELATVHTQFKEMLATGHAFQPIEVDYVFPGQGQRTLLLDAHLLTLPGHSERRLLVTFQDITTRKEALDRAQRELAHVTRVTALGELTASLAHELSQPLAAVVANASAGANWLSRSEPELGAARESLARVASDGERAAQVIARIRGLLARTPVNLGPCDLLEIVDGVLPLVRPQLANDGVVLEAKLAKEALRVIGDPVQLQQVVLNLVLNAAEASREVPGERRRVVVRTYAEESGPAPSVVVAVEDAGVGFANADAARLFDAFYTTKPTGLGMGLSISRSIVERHGGRIWGEPNRQHGATFCFALARVA